MLSDCIAEKISADLPNINGEFLPCSARLAAKYCVSQSTILKALYQLRDKGLIEFTRGSRLRIAGRRAPAKPQPANAVQRLYDKLRNSIETGEYRPGNFFPKRDYIAITERVSPHTITQVYRRLVANGLARRTGKALIVGAKELPKVSAASQPVILILVRHYHSWRSLCVNSRAENFGQAFVEQAKQFGIRLQQVLAHRDAQPNPGSVLPSGVGAVRDLIRSLGERYLGTVIAGHKGEIPDVEEWIGELLMWRRPTVWLDLAAENLATPVLSPFFSRCFSSEERFVGAALDLLCRFGHRTIGFDGRTAAPWAPQRIAVIKKLAQSHPCAPSIVECLPVPDREQWNDSAGLMADLECTSRSGMDSFDAAVSFFTDNKELLRELFGSRADPLFIGSRFAGIVSLTRAVLHSPELANCMEPQVRHHAAVIWDCCALNPLFERKCVTAMIGPSDSKTLNLLRWLRKARIPVPNKVSVIAFDNQFKYLALGLTTVDPGFGYLGFQAFHAIIGDIPVKRDKQGAIVAIPTVVDNGSVAPPRRDRRTAASLVESNAHKT